MAKSAKNVYKISSASVKPFSARRLMASRALPSSSPNILTSTSEFSEMPSISMDKRLFASPSMSPFTRVISDEKWDAVSANNFAGCACNPPTHFIEIVRSIIINQESPPLPNGQSWTRLGSFLYNSIIIQHIAQQFKSFFEFLLTFFKFFINFCRCRQKTTCFC